jgi:hypothetical protein
MASDPREPTPSAPGSRASSSQSAAEPSDNPFAGRMTVSITVPETVEVRMVDATSLSDYEWHFFISSLLSSALVGFLIASLQADETTRVPFIAFTVVLGVFFVASVIWTIVKRVRLAAKAKTIQLRYAQIEPRTTSRRRSSAPRRNRPAPTQATPAIEATAVSEESESVESSPENEGRSAAENPPANEPPK